MMRRTLFTLAVFAAPVLAGAFSASALADETSDLLTKADQAFAAADYQTAVTLYTKLDGQLTDAAKKSAMDDRLRFAKKQIAATPAAPAAAGSAAAGSPAVTATPSTQPTVSTGVATSAATRTPHVKPAAGSVLALTLHELGNFDYNEDDDKTIPDDVRKLDGATVKIEGVMMPLDQAGRVSRFMLVNDMMSCCYGTAPKLQNVAMVELPKDKWIAATTDRIAVTGKLKVVVQREDGFVLSIFQIEPTSIKLVAE